MGKSILKKGVYNIFWGVGGQVIILALSLFIPRFILKSYGDEANGLTNAIGQIFTYLALIEAGVGQAAVQALYKPLTINDTNTVSEILFATKKQFQKLTYIYIFSVFVFAFIYPLFIAKNDLSCIEVFGSQYLGVFLFILIQGVTNALFFYFISALKQLLIADGCNYIIVNITTVFRVIVSVCKIILFNLQINLVALQAVYLAITVIEVTTYIFVFRKKYPDISLKSKGNFVLEEKNSFFVHEISNAVFNSTDMFLLSLFCDLTTVSIYAIYNLVFTSVNTLVNQVHGGCYFILGQTYNKDRDEYINVHDAYDTIYMTFVFIFISISYVLILPFVSLYTNGATDISYIDTKLPILFCMIQLLSCCRITSSNLIKIAGHAKKTIPNTIAESVINLVVSIILVNIIGVYGVLLGTIIALCYRTNDMVIYSNKKILNRSPLKTYKTIIVNFLVFIAVAIISKLFIIKCENYIQFAIWGCVVSCVIILIYFIVNYLANRRVLMGVLKRYLKR